MKFLFTILAIAIMVQVSLAGPLVNHDDQLVEEFQDLITILKSYVPRTESITKDTLNDIPNDEAYSKYRQILESYLEYYEEFKTKPGNCIDKHFRIVRKLNEYGQMFEGPDASAEAQEIDKLMKAHGIESISGDIINWRAKYQIQSLGKFEDRYAKDDARLKTAYEEIC